MQKENINFDVPRLAEKAVAENRDGRKTAALILAALLFTFSIVVHFALVLKTLEYIKEEGSTVLFSALIGDYRISEPATPEKPEGNTLKNEENEEKKGDFTLLNKNLSTSAENGLALTNETSYTPDLYQLLGAEKPSENSDAVTKDDPLVLIYHTHATEGYADTAGTGFRTTDSEKNMIAVGQVAKKVLAAAGIEAIHLKDQFDAENWSRAYDNSNVAVKKALDKNPSVQYVLDLHRDCIGNDEEGYIRATTKIHEKDTAQLMMVCGTDEGGSNHTEWRENLTFGVQMQSALCKSYPSLMRPINLRRASFYQDTRPCALILECGTCAGTLEEAKRGVVLFFAALADYIKGGDAGLDTKELIDTLCP